MNPLTIIPARIGSKGIPYKNFTELAGTTPLLRALECCYEAGLYPVITSDHPAFQHSPHLFSPAPLHTDTCSMADVVADVLARKPGPDDQVIVLVQPTQPLRRPEHLRDAIAQVSQDCPSVATVVEVEPAEKLYYRNVGWGLTPVTRRRAERRQDAERTYACDGTAYAFQRGWFNTHRKFIGASTLMIIIPPDQTCRLDTPLDWTLAELRLTSKDPAHGRTDRLHYPSQ